MPATRKEQAAFLAFAVPAAQASQRKWGVPASVIIAQAILESGWGKRALGNNYFGIKAGRNQAYVEFTTHEYRNAIREKQTDKFRAFAAPAESFDAHGRLLSQSKRYKPAMAKAHDPFAFAIELQVCGYATDPNYAKHLAALMEQHKLTQFDLKEAA